MDRVAVAGTAQPARAEGVRASRGVDQVTVESRVRRVLAAMAAVSEANGQSVVVFDPNSSHKSTIPTGVRTGQALATMEPNAPRTLFEEWSVEFDRAFRAGMSERALTLLATAAETELAAYTHRPPGREVDEHGDPRRATEERALRQYAGVDVAEAAVIEARAHGGDPNRHMVWLRSLRARNGFHPETGRSRPAGEARLRRVAELRAQGLSVRRIASAVPCSTRTVQDDLKRLDEITRLP